jgi:hypothetical protein
MKKDRRIDEKGYRLRLRKCQECGRVVAVLGNFPQWKHRKGCSEGAWNLATADLDINTGMDTN